MGFVSCEAPEATEGLPIMSRNAGVNATTRLRIRGDKLLIILVISFRALQCGASEVLGDALQASSPPLLPPQGQLVQFQQVLSSLRSNNYTNGAQFISDYLFLLPLGSTLFVPTNAASNELNRNLALGPLLAYHAIVQQVSYEQLLLLPAGTRFPSLVGNNNTLVITSVAPDNFRVDGVRIVQGNVCSSSISALQISCHGVDGILNMTLWGQTGLAQLAPVPSPASEGPISELIPPVILPTPIESPANAPGPENASRPAGGASRAETWSTLLSLVGSLVLFYVFAAALTV